MVDRYGAKPSEDPHTWSPDCRATCTQYVMAVDYDKLVAALVAVCERGDTDHSAKSMYWIASDALKEAGYDSNGRPTSGESEHG